MTVVQIAREYLEKEGNSYFEDIFQAVKNELLFKWKEVLPHIPEEDLIIKKRGELYKILTITAQFYFFKEENKWGLTPIEVKLRRK